MTATLGTATTIADPPLAIAPMVSYDLYKDIHKGVRSALFAAVGAAGSVDPRDDAARAGLAGRVGELAHLLDEHAVHENVHVVPALDQVAPALADEIRTVHPVLDARVAAFRALADEVAGIGGDASRAGVHALYLELAAFTGTYLGHQDFEERRCMPALAAALPVEELLAIDHAIVASIPPDEMAAALSVMLPAMNVDDRVELLGGIQQGAPPEVFTGVCALAAAVLEPEAWTATAARLGIA